MCRPTVCEALGSELPFTQEPFTSGALGEAHASREELKHRQGRPPAQFVQEAAESGAHLSQWGPRAQARPGSVSAAGVLAALAAPRY